jgi:hypothetical protein
MILIKYHGYEKWNLKVFSAKLVISLLICGFFLIYKLIEQFVPVYSSHACESQVQVITISLHGKIFCLFFKQ